MTPVQSAPAAVRRTRATRRNSTFTTRNRHDRHPEPARPFMEPERLDPPPLRPGETRRDPDSIPIEQVWTEYKRTGGDAHRERLIVHYMREHVSPIAERLHAGLPRHVDVDDLVQQGYLGLVESIERYELDRDTKFETFSSRRIFGAMRDYLRAIDPVPRLTRNRSKIVQRAEEQFTKAHGRLPDTDELRDALNVPEAEFRRMLDDANPASMVSFNTAGAPMNGGGGAGGGGADDVEPDAMDSFEDHGLPTPLRHAEHDDLRHWVTRGFSRRDRLIIILYYYEHMTMKEIGRTIGCSESRISQRLDSILKRLRARLMAEVDPELEFFDR